jgi:hypothetical protein
MSDGVTMNIVQFTTSGALPAREGCPWKMSMQVSASQHSRR